jgi:hypothetical protein
MPPATKDRCETHAGLIFLATLASRSTDDADATVAELLAAIGWESIDGTPMTPWMANDAAWDTKAVLRRLGAFVDEPGLRWSASPTPQGVIFARAALRTWPSTD